MSAISVVAMPVIDLQLRRHRLGDDVAEVRSDEDAEQQVAGQAGKTEAAEQIAGDPGAEQREAERERSACRCGGSGRDRVLEPRPQRRPSTPARRHESQPHHTIAVRDHHVPWSTELGDDFAANRPHHDNVQEDHRIGPDSSNNVERECDAKDSR